MRRLLAYAALLVAISGIAWSAIFIRWSAVARTLVGVLPRVHCRAGAGAVAAHLVTDVARRARPVTSTTRRAFLLALGGGVFFGLDLALYNTAVMRTTATTATLFGNNSPIFVGIGTWIFFRRRPQRRFWIGLALATGWCGNRHDCERHSPCGTRPATLTGALMSIGAAAFFAAYLLATEHVREEMDTLTFSTDRRGRQRADSCSSCAWSRRAAAGFDADVAGAPWPGLDFAARRVSRPGLRPRHLPATVTSVGLLAQVPLTALLAVPLLGEAAHAALLWWRAWCWRGFTS